jgi:23S rRNA (guanine745-N1)-methyltransferase
MLLCTVRDCHQPLLREESREARRMVCPRGHSFDIARSGYINLLQPQDRRSKQPGDSVDAVSARRRLHDLGVTKNLGDAIAAILNPGPRDVVLDAGCGDGFYLGNMAGETGSEAHGVDISIPAVNAAARRFPAFEWIVANADRFVPYADASFSMVLSITGRMNSAEFRRVLRDDGLLLVAIAAPDDLIELRSASGTPGRDRVPRTLETFAGEFTLLDQRRVTSQTELDASAAQDVLISVYRPLRPTPTEAMRLTFSLDLLLLRAK